MIGAKPNPMAQQRNANAAPVPAIQWPIVWVWPDKFIT